MNRLASQAFRDDVSATREGVDMCLRSHPEDRSLASIVKQLDFVLNWSESGADPKARELKDLNFGLIASHAVEDLDADLSIQLHLISHEISHATQS